MSWYRERFCLGETSKFEKDIFPHLSLYNAFFGKCAANCSRCKIIIRTHRNSFSTDFFAFTCLIFNFTDTVTALSEQVLVQFQESTIRFRSPSEGSMLNLDSGGRSTVKS